MHDELPVHLILSGLYGHHETGTSMACKRPLPRYLPLLVREGCLLLVRSHGDCSVTKQAICNNNVVESLIFTRTNVEVPFN
jgi:hypothetical protein